MVMQSGHSALVVGDRVFAGLNSGQEGVLLGFGFGGGSEVRVLQKVHHGWFCIGVNVL